MRGTPPDRVHRHLEPQLLALRSAIALSNATLRSLYPNTVDDIVNFATDALKLAQQGFLTPSDAVKSVVSVFERNMP